MTSPYRTIVLQTKVMLRPEQMDATVYANIKENLRAHVLNKCIEAGCVYDIYNMTILDGEMRAENLSGDADVEVAYSAKVCNPQVNQMIICEIVRYGKPMFMAKNGPINVVFWFERIQLKKFNVNTEDGTVTHIATGHKLAVGDLVKVNVIQRTFNKQSESILLLCSLEDIASDVEKKMYREDIGVDKVTTAFIDESGINTQLMTEGVDFEEVTVHL